MTTGSLRDLFRSDKISLAIIGLASAVLLYFAWSRIRLTTNPLSRIITVERLVEKGTFAHTTSTDSTPFPLSIDHVKINGNIYSSKPPAYPMVMAAESALVKMITGMNFYKHRSTFVRMLVIVNQVLPYILMLVLAFAMMQALGLDEWTRRYLLLALSFGLLTFGYAVTINNHTLSGVLLFIAFWLTWRVTRQGKGGMMAAAGAGLLAGFAVANDLPAGLFLVGIIGLLLWHNWKTGLAAALMAAIPFVVSSLVYHSISGSWQPFYMQGNLYRYEGAYWTSPEGWDAVHDSAAVYLLNITFGHHGLFSLTPVLLLAVAAVPFWLRDKQFPLRPEFILIWTLVLSMGWFVATRTYNYGGACIGLRWFISFMPLLMFTAYPVVARMGQSTAGRVTCVVLLLLCLPWNAEALYWEGFIPSTFEKIWMNWIGI